jgi:hypothetical protein
MKANEVWQITRNECGKRAYSVGVHLSTLLRFLFCIFEWMSNVASSDFVGREFELKATWLFRKASMSDRYINTTNVFDLWFKVQPIMHHEAFSRTGRGGVGWSLPRHVIRFHNTLKSAAFLTGLSDIQQTAQMLCNTIEACFRRKPFKISCLFVQLVLFCSHDWENYIAGSFLLLILLKILLLSIQGGWNWRNI